MSLPLPLPLPPKLPAKKLDLPALPKPVFNAEHIDAKHMGKDQVHVKVGSVTMILTRAEAMFLVGKLERAAQLA